MEANPAPDAHPSTVPPSSASKQTQHAQTVALHADTHLNTSTDVAPPMHTSTTFTYTSDPAGLIPASHAPDPWAPDTPHVYSRETAPNSTRLETILAEIIGAPTVTYGSGLAAISALYTLLNPKKVAITGGYHGAHGVLAIFERLTGVTKVSLEDAEKELGKGDVIHLETPVNPSGECRDIARYAKIAKAKGALLIIDSTLGPPPLQDPFAHGADIVMHSGTKYFGGHSDLLLGTLSTRNKEWMAQLAEDRTYLGNVAGNMEAWLGVRSVRTLGIRVERQSANATKLVEWLEAGKRGENVKGGAVVKKVVKQVLHASVQSKESGEAWIKEQMSGGWGPLFSFILSDEEAAKRLPSKLKCFMHATSLGGVESLIEWRAMSDTTCDTKLLRVSVGIENWEDLRDDFIQAFEALAAELGL